MEDEYYWEIYEMFREQLEVQIPTIKNNILSLSKEDSFKESVDELFRIYHSYKASSSYLNLKPFNILVTKAETVLSTLRHENKVLSQSIIEWLLLSHEQLAIWLEDMELNKTVLTPINSDLNIKLKISKSLESPKEKLKTLTILYIDQNINRTNKLIEFFKKLVSDVRVESNTFDAQNLIEHYKYDILIINLDKDNYPLIQLCRKRYKNKPILSIFNSIDASTKKTLLQNGVNHTLTNPLNSIDLQRELFYLTKTYFSYDSIIIDNQKISNFIQTLKPLPNTIYQIMQICDDNDLPIKDLIKVIKSDPIISANILQTANNPMYGSVKLNTVDQAISRLGKTAIKALAMKDIYNNLGSIELSPYKINESTFSDVSIKRLSLMIKWYSKVSIGDLSILTTAALLGNIGQILISKEIIQLDEVQQFQELCETFDIKYAEEKILHTHTNIISSKILNYWKISSDIIDVISYADNPNEAPIELKKLAVAIKIVYTLIQLDGLILKEIPNNLLIEMKENDFNVKHLQNALDFINSI